MNVRIAALLATTMACTYPKLPLLGDGRSGDGRLGDGRLGDGQLGDGQLGDGQGAPDGMVGCPLLSSYSVTFTPGSGSDVGQEVAQDLGAQGGLAELLEWEGVLSTAPTAQVIIELAAGGGAQTPDWPTGGVTPKSGISLGSSQDVFVGIGVDFSGNQPLFGYLATSGTLNITSVSPNLAGDVVNVSFRQFDNLFSGSGSPSPDPDGCTTSMTSIDYDAPLTTGSAGVPVRRMPHVTP